MFQIQVQSKSSFQGRKESAKVCNQIEEYEQSFEIDIDIEIATAYIKVLA